MEIQRRGEKEGRDPAQVAEEVKVVVDGYIAMLRQTTDLNEVPLSHYTRFYDDMGNRLEVPNYEKERGDYEALCCSNCMLYFDDTLKNCPYCGEPNPKPMTAVAGEEMTAN